jgi:adenylate cyclase
MLKDLDKIAKFPIQLKLMSLVSIVFILTTTLIIFLATTFFKKDNEVRVKDANIKLTELVGLTVKSELESIVQKSKQMAITLTENELSPNLRNLFTKLFFDSDSDIIFLSFLQYENNTWKLVKSASNSEYLVENNLTEIELMDLIQRETDKFKPTLNGKIGLANLSLGKKIPLMVLSIPFAKDLFQDTIIISILKPTKFLRAFETRGISETFMVSDEGKIIAHPDLKLVLSVGDYSKMEIVQSMLKSTLGNGQIRFFKEEDNQYYIGTFKRIGLGGAGIISIVSEDKIFEEAYNIQRRNIYIVIIALCISLMVIFQYSKSITNPILRLLEATNKLSRGEFDVKVDSKNNDEVGLLSANFMKMSSGLQEREKVKDALGRFVNPAIVEMILAKDLKLGGETKECAIFFSDIRGFTSICEKMTPEEVVGFLNEYMSMMVECVDMTFGIVDKFIGDAIMATWGATESYGNKCQNAINCAIMMRRELIKFNAKRDGSEKQPKINIGCGINFGPAIAGQIGSENRLEFTVIGDSVNLASRIESLNKPFGTDILISSEMVKHLEDKYILEKMRPVTVKGKEEEQNIYAVIGRYDDPDPNAPKTLGQLRKQLGIEFDVKKYNLPLDETEKKYSIL